LAEQVRKIIEKDSMPVIIGGDHSIALGTAQGIRESKVNSMLLSGLMLMLISWIHIQKMRNTLERQF
ncbi:MAG: arginase family protein, partial [Candidatus Heimdallarchaeota archaeon]